MNSEFNIWLAKYVAALESGCCLAYKDVVLRKPIDPKEIGREVAARMSYRPVGHTHFTDRCIPLEPR